MTRAALTPMLAAGSGSIVYVGSRAAVRPFAGAAPYIVAKGAVLALMGAVDAEVRTKGVRVNTVMASIVDTPRNRRREPRRRLLALDDRRPDGARDRVALRRGLGAALRRRDPRLRRGACMP